jgi:PAS domain-containing protein
VKLLINPMFVHLAAALFLFVAAVVAGIVLIRWMRRQMVDDRVPEGAGEAVPLHTYAVIQQLKQQKFALENEQRRQSRRAKTSEQMTAGVMAKLPWGVLLIARNGLVRQANAAARELLGFLSPLGMNLEELFRDTRFVTASGKQTELAEALAGTLRGSSSPGPIECCYGTPASVERRLKLTLIPIDLPSGETLGVLVAFSDETELCELRESERMRVEASAEMAFSMRSSLACIREWAEQFRRIAPDVKGQNLAADIVAEAERLDQSLSGFVRGSSDAVAARA